MVALGVAIATFPGCGSSSRSVLDEGVHFGALRSFHRIGPAEAVRSVQNGHRMWLAALHTAAARNPTHRFSSPPLGVLMRRLAKAAQRYDFRVVSVRMRRPDQLAPDLVVESDRYVALAKALPRILDAVDPPPASNDRAYEGIFLEAVDEHGIPFVEVADSLRSQAMGRQWARADRLYPYAHG